MSDVAPSGPNIPANLLELFCDALDAAVFVTDKFDCITFASRRLLKFFTLPEARLQTGTRARDLLGSIYDSGLRFAHGSDIQAAGQSREEWIAERIAFNWRERHESQEQIGRDRWVRIINRRLANGVGLTAILDISDHKKREAVWNADIERVELTEEILDELPVPLFVQDQNLNFAAVNKAFCKLQGTTSDSLIGRSIWDIFAPDLATEHEEAARRQLETGRPRNKLLPMRRPNGEAFNILASSNRIGRPGHFYLANVFSDVTAFFGADTISPAGQEVPQPEQGSHPLDIIAPSEFAPVGSEMDFDIVTDTPFGNFDDDSQMPGKSASLHVLVMSEDDKVSTQLIAQIKRHGHDAVSLRDGPELAQFLSVARQAGLTVDLVMIDPISMCGADAGAKIAAIRASASDYSTRCLDVARLANGQLDPGQIDAVFGVPRVVIAPPPLQPDLQALQSAPKAYEPRPERPERSTVAPEAKDLPEAPASIPVPQPKLKIGDVLVVEANAVNRLVFSQIFESIGMEHRVVGTASMAIEAYRQSRPAMMMIDYRLPDMNGYQLAHHIRETEQDTKTPLICVISPAYGDRESAIAAGMNDVIMKPLSPDSMDNILRQHLLGEEANASVGKSSATN